MFPFASWVVRFPDPLVKWAGKPDYILCNVFSNSMLQVPGCQGRWLGGSRLSQSWHPGQNHHAMMLRLIINIMLVLDPQNLPEIHNPTLKTTKMKTTTTTQTKTMITKTDNKDKTATIKFIFISMTMTPTKTDLRVQIYFFCAPFPNILINFWKGAGMLCPRQLSHPGAFPNCLLSVQASSYDGKVGKSDLTILNYLLPPQHP